MKRKKKFATPTVFRFSFFHRSSNNSRKLLLYVVNIKIKLEYNCTYKVLAGGIKKTHQVLAKENLSVDYYEDIFSFWVSIFIIEIRGKLAGCLWQGSILNNPDTIILIGSRFNKTYKCSVPWSQSKNCEQQQLVH